MAEKNIKMTPFEQERIDVCKQVLEYKKQAEANVVAILYKNPDELFNTNLTIDSFSSNQWKVFFEIAQKLIVVEKKRSLDEMTIGFYLDHHRDLRKKYDEYGGYDTIDAAMTYVKTENLNGYIIEMQKWEAVLKLGNYGFPVKDRLSDYADMTSEEIYNELEARLNHTFVDVDDEIKSYDIADGIDELLDELNEGIAVGLPYYNLPMLSKEVGGQYLGGITLVGGLSNVGKSSFCRTTVLPSIIENKERIVIMLNEDGLKKWQRELIVFVCNNYLKYDIQKHIVRDGGYSPETREILDKAVKWIKDKTENHIITVIPLQQYKTSKAIKIIRKYASMGVKYFIIDTFKMDAGEVTNNSWLQMQQSMVDINDVVKPEAMNLHILITFQLSKASSRQRYYTQDNIGLAKNIIDPVSTCLMIRDVAPDEYKDESRELEVTKYLGKGSTSQFRMEKGKRYQIIFVIKNREGEANTKQFVVEHDLSRNKIEEIGTCNIMPDTF